MAVPPIPVERLSKESASNPWALRLLTMGAVAILIVLSFAAPIGYVFFTTEVLIAVVYATSLNLLMGYGGMLSLELSGGGKAADRFLRRLKLIQHATSLGGVDSLVSEPRYSSHARLTSEERAKIGIPDGFLRLSIGIEDADDLIADIEQALK